MRRTAGLEQVNHASRFGREVRYGVMCGPRRVWRRDNTIGQQDVGEGEATETSRGVRKEMPSGDLERVRHVMISDAHRFHTVASMFMMV